MKQARTLAEATSSTETVRALFDAGSDGNRLTALAIIPARPELADMPSLRRALATSRSRHKHYEALVAIEGVLGVLPEQSVHREELTSAVNEAISTNKCLPRSANRLTIARRIISNS